MQYSISKLEKGKVEVKVDIPKSAFDEAYNQTLLEFGKEATIAGFRPGKVPADVVEGKVGTNKILNQTASFLISKHLSEILKKEDLVPLESPKIAINSLSKGAPFSFNVSFTQKPQVKLGDWKKIKVKKITAKEITGEDVGKSVENIYQAWKTRKSDVGSQRSDEKGQPSFAKASTDAKALADKSEGEQSEKSEAEDGSGKFIYDAHGNKLFFEKSLRSSSPEKLGTAGLKINNHSGPDDGFAKAIGARDLAHLRELVKKDLETLVADQVEIKFEQEIFEKFRDIGTVEVPDVLIDDELNRMLVRLATELEKQERKLDDYLKEQKTTVDELKAKWREQALNNVKISLILDQIGKEENIKVTEEEMSEALKGVNQTNLSNEQKDNLEKYAIFSIFQAKTLAQVKKTVSV